MIVRDMHSRLTDALTSSIRKIWVLYGPRQVGKTTLLRQLIPSLEARTLFVNADEQRYTNVLSSRDLTKLRGLVSGYDLLVIDEAQRVRDIGINLKLLYDTFPELQILVTGSSSLDLADRLREPLTGRTRTYQMFPVSVAEWKNHFETNEFETKQELESWLRFGFYPEVLLYENFNEKRQHLSELSQAYLYKDILMLANVRYPEKLRQLLKLLAFQIGQLVSIHELAVKLQINRETVIHYLDLLEKSFVIFRLSGFRRNLRKEVTSMNKIYFYDLGIRNAILENFAPLDERNDVGALWENFLLVERLKFRSYTQQFGNTYFWRTHSGAELDYVEENNGKLAGYEFKWNPKKRRKAPKTWLETYAESSWQLINTENFLPFVVGG